MNIIFEIRREFKKNSNKGLQKSGQNFFKEPIKSYGIKTATVIKISKDYFSRIKEKSTSEIFKLCENLWQSGYMEESFIACNWSYLIHPRYEEKHLQIFEKWLSSYVSNWASCDTLCNHSIGTYIEMYPIQISKLKKWATSQNRWMRRAAAVTLIIPARKGKFLGDIFEIADILLTDTDDLVQKGYGWMLKAASQAHQEQVFNYVIKNKDNMPRTALRYAIEKMPKELKKEAMSK